MLEINDTTRVLFTIFALVTASGCAAESGRESDRSVVEQREGRQTRFFLGNAAAEEDDGAAEEGVDVPSEMRSAGRHPGDPMGADVDELTPPNPCPGNDLPSKGR